MVTAQHKPSHPQASQASSVKTVGPTELGGQRQQVSQVPEGVSGEEGIHPTDDSDGVRDLRKRMDVASLVACSRSRGV